MADNKSAVSTNQTIADILLSKQLISADVANLIKTESFNTGKKQEEVIVARNLVPPKTLANAKAQMYQMPFVDIAAIAVNPQAMSKLPQAVAERFVAFPYQYVDIDHSLSVVMADPLDVAALDFLEQKSQCKVIPSFGVEADIKQAISDKYSQGLSTDVDAAVKEVDFSKKRVVDEKNINEVIREAPIAKIVTTLLSFAMKSMASDIHIEPMEDKTRVRYRIDGILHEKLILPKGVHDAVVSRIKILGGMKIDEKRVPQDGRFSFRSDEKEVDLRVSTLPAAHGEKIVMRLLQKGQSVPELSELGFRGRALKNVEDAIKATHGVILVTGPTGSGKTTTLYSLLHKLNTLKVNIITLEDPIEYEMTGVNQVQTNPQAGLTFASGLRSILRQDPNIIMVGEVRDMETAELTVNAALTGHLVFSTLHTNSAAGALPRLIDMGVEPFLLASAVNLVIAQRVVRKICSACKESYRPTPEIVDSLQKALGPIFKQFDPNNILLYRGKHCEACNNTGYKGRIGIYEVMPVSEKISLQAISKVPTSEIERTAVGDGMLTMYLDGYLKALEGITTIEEVMRVAQG